MDLKALLVEAKQKDPPVLQVLLTEDEMMMDIGGTNYCMYLVLKQAYVASWGHGQNYCNIIAQEALQCSKVEDIYFLFFHSRRERLYILWWFGPQDHRLSQTGGHAGKTGHHGFFKLFATLPSNLSLREAPVSCLNSILYKMYYYWNCTFINFSQTISCLLQNAVKKFCVRKNVLKF